MYQSFPHSVLLIISGHDFLSKPSSSMNGLVQLSPNDRSRSHSSSPSFQQMSAHTRDTVARIPSLAAPRAGIGCHVQKLKYLRRVVVRRINLLHSHIWPHRSSTSPVESCFYARDTESKRCTTPPALHIPTQKNTLPYRIAMPR